ncbi:MAG: hypothetical protein ABIR70_15825 [Bryobacteraceae bacterium]
MKRTMAVLAIAGGLGSAVFGQQYPPQNGPYQNDPYYNGQYDNGQYNDPNYNNGNQGVYAPAPPPPPSYAYQRPPIPGSGYYWIDGYWNYLGGRYAWVGGYWAQPPYAGGYWVAPRYNGGRFFLGFWGGRGGVSLGFSSGGGYGNSYYGGRPYVQNRVIIQAPRQQVYRGNGGGNNNRGNGNGGGNGNRGNSGGGNRGGGNRGGGRR